MQQSAVQSVVKSVCECIQMRVLYKAERATSHDKTFNAHSNTTYLVHSDLFTVLKGEYNAVGA